VRGAKAAPFAEPGDDLLGGCLQEVRVAEGVERDAALGRGPGHPVEEVGPAAHGLRRILGDPVVLDAGEHALDEVEGLRVPPPEVQGRLEAASA
jgi:hypothetical protein